MRCPIKPALVVLAVALSGCREERQEITPTTLGTDLKRIPRGQMTPFAWPGQDIVQAPTPATARSVVGEAPVDPDTSPASGRSISR